MRGQSSNLGHYSSEDTFDSFMTSYFCYFVENDVTASILPLETSFTTKNRIWYFYFWKRAILFPNNPPLNCHFSKFWMSAAFNPGVKLMITIIVFEGKTNIYVGMCNFYIRVRKLFTFSTFLKQIRKKMILYTNIFNK